MKANYHTHTARCGHAEGTDEQYVLAAIGAGYDTLGFSDHVPYPYKSGFTSPTVRMTMDKLPEYVDSVARLKDKYEEQIRILTGFECEYFPEYMNWMADMKEEQGLDYLILGNHYELTDETGMYYGHCKTGAQLARYVDNTIKGMETGLFAYLAHPDLFMRAYGRFDDDARAAARDLAAACKAMNLPMEYNVHDRFIAYLTNRISYPHPEFFDIAAQAGVRIIIGVDAHEPRELSDTTQWDRAMGELARFGDLHIGHLDL